MTHLLWVWGPAAVLMAVIFGLSSISDIPAPPGGLSDVSVHAIVYAALGYSWSAPSPMRAGVASRRGQWLPQLRSLFSMGRPTNITSRLWRGDSLTESSPFLVSPAGMVETPRLQAKRRAW